MVKSKLPSVEERKWTLNNVDVLLLMKLTLSFMMKKLSLLSILYAITQILKIEMKITEFREFCSPLLMNLKMKN